MDCSGRPEPADAPLAKRKRFAFYRAVKPQMQITAAAGRAGSGVAQSRINTRVRRARVPPHGKAKRRDDSPLCDAGRAASPIRAVLCQSWLRWHKG